MKFHLIDKRVSQLVVDGKRLDHYVHSRHIPMEAKDAFSAKKQIEKNVLNETGIKRISDLGIYSFSKFLSTNIVY